MKNKDFCVFILTHGRPNKVLTYKTLQRCGYTGKTYFIVDNEDKTINQYYENFGKSNVIVFDKKEIADRTDEGNNFDNRKVIVHARNACFEIAKQLGIAYFMELDDDYYEIRYQFEGVKGLPLIKNIDNTFDILIDFYKKTNAKTIAFAQMGDFIGGLNNGKGSYRFSKRKCMNSFLCSTDREFKFIGSINEDVNSYTLLGSRGELFLTIPVVAINQKDTQPQKGGMTEIYRLNGTYVKSFSTIIMHPSSVRISMMQCNHVRLHHSIKWINTVPVILNEKYRLIGGV